MRVKAVLFTAITSSSGTRLIYSKSTVLKNKNKTSSLSILIRVECSQLHVRNSSMQLLFVLYCLSSQQGGPRGCRQLGRLARWASAIPSEPQQRHLQGCGLTFRTSLSQPLLQPPTTVDGYRDRSLCLLMNQNPCPLHCMHCTRSRRFFWRQRFSLCLLQCVQSFRTELGTKYVLKILSPWGTGNCYLSGSLYFEACAPVIQWNV